MPEKCCNGDWNNGAPICTEHGERLVDRATAEATFGKLNQPTISGWFCPVTGSMVSFSTAGHDVIRGTGTKLPER